MRTKLILCNRSHFKIHVTVIYNRPPIQKKIKKTSAKLDQLADA
jgi:hypothetical protein